MAIKIASITLVQDYIITKEKEAYGLTMYNETCDEIRALAIELNLHCLRYQKGTATCLFNDDQREDILAKEIPLLRSKNLSQDAQKALDGLEFFIQDMHNPYGFLLLESDTYIFVDQAAKAF